MRSDIQGRVNLHRGRLTLTQGVTANEKHRSSRYAEGGGKPTTHCRSNQQHNAEAARKGLGTRLVQGSPDAAMPGLGGEKGVRPLPRRCTSDDVVSSIREGGLERATIRGAEPGWAFGYMLVK